MTYVSYDYASLIVYKAGFFCERGNMPLWLINITIRPVWVLKCVIEYLITKQLTFHISACINIYNQVDKIKRKYTVYTVLTMSK
jgi:hypothetical protein